MSTAFPAWKQGEISGCDIRPLRFYEDDRGWLAEFFRCDELPKAMHPRMGYVSLTRSGVVRGPHEHVAQTDLFLFFSGAFRLYLWDTRPDSPSFGCRFQEEFGADRPAAILVPPGVVHAYRNVGAEDAWIVNCPNRLYAGEGKGEPVDEIRYEDRSDSPFAMD